VPAPDAEPLKFSSKFACSTPQQFMIILRKFFTLYNRMPEYNAVRFFFTCVFGLLIGAIFWRKGNKRYTAIFFQLPAAGGDRVKRIESKLSSWKAGSAAVYLLQT